MTDHKFTDDDVIKALRCCAQPDPICKECPYFDPYLHYPCADQLKWAALNLIDHQKTEIEKLQAIHADMNESLRLASEANKDMSAELYAMRGAANSYKMHYETARATAIKEFADNVKAIFECDLCFDADVKGYIIKEIEDIEKEMTEAPQP